MFYPMYRAQSWTLMVLLGCFQLRIFYEFYFFLLLILFSASFRCDVFEFLFCKSSFLILAATDYPSSFASVGFTFLPFFFRFVNSLFLRKIYLKGLEQHNYTFSFYLNKLATYILIFCPCVYQKMCGFVGCRSFIYLRSCKVSPPLASSVYSSFLRFAH